MKSPRNIINLTALVALLSLSHHASAQVLTSFTPPGTTANLSPTPTFVWDPADLTVGALTLNNVTNVARNRTFNGWDTTFNLNKFVGFTVAPTAGEELNLTSLTFTSWVTSDPLGNTGGTAFEWGYRIDTGSGYGDWTLSAPSSVMTSSNTQTWDFNDFTTTGTVQFGFFADAPKSTGNATIVGTFSPNNNLALNGTVEAVPEPSSIYLGLMAVLTLGFFGSRRRCSQS